MKRILCFLFVLCILFAGCGDGREQSEGISESVSGGVSNRRPADEEGIGNAELTTVLPKLAQSEALTAEELKERLSGVTPDNMRELWGEPDGSCSGMWCDIWLVGGNTYLYVYYDADGIVQEVKKAPKFDWGVTLTAKDITAKGLTIVCTQSGGDPTGELQTGSWYTVQQLVDGEWKKVEYTAISEDQVAWTMEAWAIPREETVEWAVDWSWLYDELPAGEYRIGKEIMDLRDTGEYDQAVLYAEFTIE